MAWIGAHFVTDLIGETQGGTAVVDLAAAVPASAGLSGAANWGFSSWQDQFALSSWTLSQGGALSWTSLYNYGVRTGTVVVEGADSSAKKVYGLVNYKLVSPTFNKALSVTAGQAAATTLDVAAASQTGGMPGMTSVWSFYGDTASLPSWVSMTTAGVLSVQPTAGAANGVYRFYVGSAPMAGMYPSTLGSVDVTVTGGSGVLLNGAVVTRGSTQSKLGW